MENTKDMIKKHLPVLQQRGWEELSKISHKICIEDKAIVEEQLRRTDILLLETLECNDDDIFNQKLQELIMQSKSQESAWFAFAAKHVDEKCNACENMTSS